MKKGFTLIELMVVIVVIATLMTITMRIAGIGGDASRRNTTIVRLQCLENCLSGYFAAFGSYPPVPLQASRNVYREVDNESGMQRDSGETSNLKWANVRAACRAQPLAARFPLKNTKSMNDYVEAVSKIMSARANSNDPQWEAYQSRKDRFGAGFHALHNLDDVPDWQSEYHWSEVQIFQFGVMSFLLPRYLFMANGIEENQRSSLADCAQWMSNNRLSSNPNTGASFGDWQSQFEDTRLLQRVPSQAVCARWMPNLKGIVDGSGANRKFFGVDIWSGYSEINPDNVNLDVYINQNYTILDSMTVRDGWQNEFYYYSAPPFQSHRLWSAGPNGTTFPPWVSLDNLKNEGDRRTASSWMSDDIEFLNN